MHSLQTLLDGLPMSTTDGRTACLSLASTETWQRDSDKEDGIIPYPPKSLRKRFTLLFAWEMIGGVPHLQRRIREFKIFVEKNIFLSDFDRRGVRNVQWRLFSLCP